MYSSFALVPVPGRLFRHRLNQPQLVYSRRHPHLPFAQQVVAPHAAAFSTDDGTASRRSCSSSVTSNVSQRKIYRTRSARFCSVTVTDGSSSAKSRCILAQYAKPPVSPPFAQKYARNALLFIWVVQRMRRTPPEAGADCWAREDPADTKPAGGDDGCEGLLGGRAAPRARLAVRMLSRPAPAPDAPWRPPGSGPLRVLFNSIIHF
ncbi:unnamed protein product [Parnassius apollo]|uniref:(apollo) hypothetical protein n=1 Tax=Parnassius apollo TaxID=110799 RepID=A0A8S3XS63_PARAO|nr:unnamed protein product [Parnassius apollo]